MVYLVLCRKECRSGDAPSKISESDPEELSDEASADTFYGASPPSTPRQMKRMSTKHQKNNISRPAGRSTSKGECGALAFSLKWSVTAVACCYLVEGLYRRLSWILWYSERTGGSCRGLQQRKTLGYQKKNFAMRLLKQWTVYQRGCGMSIFGDF